MSKERKFVKDIASKKEDFSRWYVELVTKTKLADYSPVKGCMVIPPYGFALWENTRAGLDRRIKETGHQNAYFPLFIPEALLKKEAEHVEGFAPEVAWVTHGGDKKLEERLAVRPTSEAIICSMYSKWINSYRDLPVLINQWANVVRWEKVTRLFLRTTEFLWQEGHTAHATEEEALEETLKMLDVYEDFVEKDLAIPVIKGVKTASERFAGAVDTYCIEAMMCDGKGLQAGTTHNLGQGFAKAFNITFLDKDQERKYVWQTSWGVSTRLIGAIIMVHGDERGLKLPPKIAPIQSVIVPIMAKDSELVLKEAEDIYKQLSENGIRMKLDDRDEYKPGWKYNEWEMRGVPIRLEIGPKDIEKNQVVLVRRDTHKKYFISREELIPKIKELLEAIQLNMFNMAKEFMLENTHIDITDYKKFCKTIKKKRGFIYAGWCGSEECEAKIKEHTKATIRCIPFGEEGQGGDKEDSNCIYCGKEAKHRVYFARSY